jgi:HD-like signal output (HDOD) protein
MMFAELPNDEAAWIQALEAAEIPVLGRTVEELAHLRENEERVVARDIARVLLHDPMFTLRVLRYLQANRRSKQNAEITTVEHALMMLGVTPFFAHFSDLPAVELTLAEQPIALDGLRHVVYRAHQAALYANDWATLRSDRNPSEVAIAALLHDIAEMLLWCFAPETALRIAAMRHADPNLRSAAAQQSVLGFTLAELQAVLIRDWQLPELLRSLMDDAEATRPRVMNVALAVNLARHSARGWEDPALPDDIVALEQFLKLPLPEVLGRIRRTAQLAETSRDWYHVQVAPVPDDLESRIPGVQDCEKSVDS